MNKSELMWAIQNKDGGLLDIYRNRKDAWERLRWYDVEGDKVVRVRVTVIGRKK